MTLSQSAVSDLLDAFRAGDGVNLIRDAVQLVLQEMIETEAGRAHRRWPLRTLRGPRHRTQRSPPTPAGDPGRRCRVAHPEAPQRQLHAVDPRAPPPYRPGVVCGGDGGLRRRRLDALGR